mgnify:CR=1 FL=1
MTRLSHDVLLRLALALALTAGMTGCGFHLRGSVTATLPAVRLDADPPFRYDVEHALQRSDIRVTTDEHAPLVTLTDDHVDYKVLSLDARGTAREYEVVHTIHLTVQCGDKNLIPPATLAASRIYSATETAWLGTQAEAQQAADAAAQNLAGQILSRLAGVKTTSCEKPARPPNARTLHEPKVN